MYFFLSSDGVAMPHFWRIILLSHPLNESSFLFMKSSEWFIHKLDWFSFVVRLADSVIWMLWLAINDLWITFLYCICSSFKGPVYICIGWSDEWDILLFSWFIHLSWFCSRSLYLPVPFLISLCNLHTNAKGDNRKQCGEQQF